MGDMGDGEIRYCDQCDQDWEVTQVTTDGVERRVVQLDGETWELDLCPRHRAELDEYLAPYLNGAPLRRRYQSHQSWSDDDG